MNARIGLAASCLTLLAACQRHDAIPGGTVVIDEPVALARGATEDTASRTLTINDDCIVVAIVDEQLTDVRLRIAATDGGGQAIGSTEVENHLDGAGVEIATLRVPEDAQVTVTLTTAPDAMSPGKVSLRVQLYGAAAESNPKFASPLRAFDAWSDATDSKMRPDTFEKAGLNSINQALASLSEHGDAALAAEAHLLRAKLLNYYKLDQRESRAEAQRASQAFASLPAKDALDLARARYMEARALIGMSADGDSVDPTPDEARKLAVDILEALAASESPLGPVERARALGTLARLDLRMMRTKEATSRFEQARSLYQAAGWMSGEREMRLALPMVLVEEGRFSEAATAFDPLLAEIDALTDPELRADAYHAAGRAQSMSNRLDEGLSLLLKALPLAREFQLRAQEAQALEEIGYIFRFRGDFQQAMAFYEEAVNLTRTLKDSTQYSIALAAAAGVARTSGDEERHFELATESLRASSTPIAQARNHHELALYYRQKDDIPAAIAEYRAGLAVDLGDPRHHAHTDGKMYLALALMDLENITPKDRAEAESLIAEALEISIAVHDDFREFQSRRMQAQINLKLGKTQEALAGFHKTLEQARQWRERSSSSDMRSTMTKEEQYAFRGLLDIALADVARRPAGELRRASPAELSALLQLERARQRSFGALRVGTLDGPTVQRVDDLLQEMGQKSLRISALLDTDLDEAQAAELHSLQLEKSRLHAELDNLRSSAATKHAQVAIKSIQENQTWRAIAPGAVHLSYAFGDEYVYALVRSVSGTHVTRLAPTRKALEKQLAELSQLDVQNSSRQIEAALERASTALLPAGLLPADSSTVYIVAEGRIASVPFPGLRSPIDSKRRLVETHEVAMVTTLLGIDEAPRPKGSRPFRFVALASGSGTYRAAVLADPTPRLNAARKEISTAAALFKAQDPAAKIKLFAGPDGNAATLRDIWASGADVVHFATHALADLRQPVASLLVLPATDANGKATYLTAGQVQTWRGDTELVFLSACESAIGPPQYAAGMPGLQRAFLRAGARGVIATLAPIEDVLAQQFAEDFYSRYTKGVPSARALVETQRAWLAPKPGMSEEEQLRRRVMALAHAYFAG
jgi:CHAT domain-containing protein